MVKVIEAIQKAVDADRHFFAFEFVVPMAEAGMVNLYECIERMCGLGPLFCGMTWGDHGCTADSTIEVAATCQSLVSCNCQVNITGYTSTPAEMTRWLDRLKARGIRNLLVLRGNPGAPASDNKVHFPHAADLVRFIRSNYEDYFGIAVAGNPEGNDESVDEETELRFLKEKVDAGADLVITQMVFDAQVFLNFTAQCRKAGITCPIIPGVMPIHSYSAFSSLERQKLAGMQLLHQKLEAAGNDASQFKKVSAEFTHQIIRTLFEHGVRGVYLFTMNVETIVSAIVKGLGFTTHRDLPWKPAENEERRKQELVRPIHWSARSSSYLARTSQWNRFPTGRWGDTQSPEYSEETTYHTRLLLQGMAKRCPQFLTVEGIEDIPRALRELCRVFFNFLDGHGALPWADELSGESEYVMEKTLKPLNIRALFTINSQPHMNGVSSMNRVVGWGPPNGFIYQKAYLEFFCSRADAQTVLSTFDKYPSLQYMTMDAEGNMIKTNYTASGSDSVTAVTWGVFPGSEIVQPTIVSIDSFRSWVTEAFDLWGAPFHSRELPQVIRTIKSQWVLINVVDNVFQESPSPIELAVAEVCSKIPPVLPTDAVSSAQSAIPNPILRYKQPQYNLDEMKDFLAQQERLLQNAPPAKQ